MLDLTADGGGGAPDAVVPISIDEISAEIATGRVIWPDYVDYLHLVSTSDGSKIANVLLRHRH
jgi:hypothetical protein